MRKLSFLATLLMLVPFTLAQTPTGTIEGTVQDSSGASVAGATVTVTSSATGASKQLTSDAAGRFQLPFVAPGSYKVTVAANGFRSAEQNEIVVEVSQKRVLSFTLSVGKVSETVEVQATAPVLDTQTSSLGEVVQTRTITDLPLNGRNPFALATLVPTVVDDSGNAPIPHIGGGRDSTSEVQIDGMSNILPENNVGDNILAYRPIVDSVQEFSVQTNVLPAEYGRFSGGTISLVTRSGGEKYHGTGFLFARNGVLDALSYFSKPDSPKADTHQYQSGFTFGGPVPLLGHRKRTFFFFAYENSQASIAGQETDTLPLPEWYSGATAGDFSALIPAGTDCNATPASGCIYDPLSVDPVTKKRLAFPGNIIPQARLNNPASQIAIKMLSFYPAPNANGNGFNYTVVGAAPTTYSHWDARIDHDFTKDWHSFLRVSHFDQHSLGGNSLSDYGDNNPASQGFGGPDHQNAWTAAFNNTVTFSPTLLGEFRYGVSRSAEKRTGAGGNFDPSTLGLPAYVGQTAGPQGQIFPRLNLSDGFSGLGPNGFNAFSQNPFAHDITGSIVKIAGSHAIKFGAEFRKIYSNFYQFGLPTGQYNLDRTWTQDVAQSTEDGTGTGNPFAGFLLGLAASGDTDHTPSAASSSGYFAAFIQDDWKVTRRLTVNLGLRYDFEIPKTERFDKLSYWDPTVASPLGSVTPAPGVNCPHCANLLGAMFFPGTTGKFGRRQGPTQYKDFGPRIGFAYDVGHGLVVRSGFGIVFAPSDLQAAGTSGGVGNQGFQSQTQFSSSFDNQVTVHATIDDPYPADPTTGQRYNLPLGAAGGPLTQVGSGISDSFFSSYRNPYNIQWNFNVQYALPGNATLEVGYLGNHGLFLVDGDPGENVDQLPTADLALGNALFTQVANPFFGVIHTPGSSLSNPTVQANQLLRQYPQYTGVQSFRKPTAESKYNAFTVRVNKHFSNGLSLLANFTGSKETDDSAAPVTFIGQTSATRVNQYDPRAEWAVGPQDISRVFSAGYVYELPFGRGKRFLSGGGALNWVVGGWQADGIIRWTTGTPVVIAGIGDPTGILAGIGNGERPLWNGKSAKLSHQSHNEWFDTSVFSPLPQFTLGTAPRTIPNVRTPGLANADLSFSKNNYFGSDNRFNAQFRADLFNAFNHPRWDKPDANVNDCSARDASGVCTDGNFGKITSVRNSSRQIQLAVKFIF